MHGQGCLRTGSRKDTFVWKSIKLLLFVSVLVFRSLSGAITVKLRTTRFKIITTKLLLQSINIRLVTTNLFWKSLINSSLILSFIRSRFSSLATLIKKFPCRSACLGRVEKLEMIESNVKCRYLKKLTCLMAPSPPMTHTPPALTHCIRVYCIFIHTWEGGGS